MTDECTADEEINWAVAKKLQGETPWAMSHNYCGDWADIGPVIEQHKIGLDFDCCWQAYTNSVENIAVSSNPKRAAAICYLMLEVNRA